MLTSNTLNEVLNMSPYEDILHSRHHPSGTKHSVQIQQQHQLDESQP